MCKLKKAQPTEEAFEEAAKTMRLATAALDHPYQDDEELEKLCDETLSTAEERSKRKKL